MGQGQKQVPDLKATHGFSVIRNVTGLAKYAIRLCGPTNCILNTGG